MAATAFAIHCKPAVRRWPYRSIGMYCDADAARAQRSASDATQSAFVVFALLIMLWSQVRKFNARAYYICLCNCLVAVFCIDALTGWYLSSLEFRFTQEDTIVRVTSE